MLTSATCLVIPCRGSITGGSAARARPMCPPASGFIPPRDSRAGSRPAAAACRPRAGAPRSASTALRSTTVAVLHHQHLVGHEAHHRQVVADEDVGQAEFVLQVLEQVEHLRLHRDVERADRLVEHQHLGVERQAARDRDALALAAGELVRVLAQRRVVEADLGEQRAAPAPRARRRRRRCRGSSSARPASAPIVKRGFSEA